MKKTIAGLAALLASVSCSAEIKSNPPVSGYSGIYGVCSIDSTEACTPNYRLYSDSESVTELNPETFDSVVLENKLPVVVDFYAEWCAPCMHFKPIFEKVCAEYGGRLVCSAYNVDQDEENINSIHYRYGVTGIPATRFFNDGTELEKQRIAGGRPESILRSIFDAFLKECGE